MAAVAAFPIAFPLAASLNLPVSDRSMLGGQALEGKFDMDLIRLLFAILLPPLGVFLQVGFRGAFWLNILLTLCGYIPGIVHAVWIIARR